MSEAGLRDVGGSIFHLPIGGWDPGSWLTPVLFRSPLPLQVRTAPPI